MMSKKPICNSTSTTDCLAGKLIVPTSSMTYTMNTKNHMWVVPKNNKKMRQFEQR